jgi:hypothetical protein
MEGSLHAVGEDGYLVTLDVYDGSTGLLRRVSLPEESVFRVDYHEESVKPIYPVVGALLLGVAGFVASSSLIDGDDPGSRPGILLGTLGGGALGFTLGAMLGPRRTQTVHIDCSR